jgi:hypothetical protein
MFFISCFKISTCLSYISLLTTFKFHLVYTTFVVLVRVVFSRLKVVLYCFLLCLLFVCLFFNNLVIVLVFLSMHVNVAHFCFCIVLGVLFLFCLVPVFKYFCCGYLLVCNIVLCIVVRDVCFRLKWDMYSLYLFSI